MFRRGFPAAELSRCGLGESLDQIRWLVVQFWGPTSELYYKYNEIECDGFVYWNMAYLAFLIAISIIWAIVLWAPKQRTSSLFRTS